jgi:hypothetical protein
MSLQEYDTDVVADESEIRLNAALDKLSADVADFESKQSE